MSVFSELRKGLGNLEADKRREVYCDLRAALGLSETEPLLPLAEAELETWAQRYAELLCEEFSKRPATQLSANFSLLKGGLLEYARPADDAFLDSQLPYGPVMRDAGLSGLYLSSVINLASLVLSVRAAREVLPAASVTIVETRYPAAVLLRHALAHEGFLGTSKLSSQ